MASVTEYVHTVPTFPPGVDQDMVDRGVDALHEAGFYTEYGESPQSAVIAIYLAMKAPAP